MHEMTHPVGYKRERREGHILTRKLQACDYIKTSKIIQVNQVMWVQQ